MLENLHLTWSDWLAIYAALVSTIVAAIKLAAFRRENRTRLIVQLDFVLLQPRLELTIVNDSAFPVYVHGPSYSLRYVGPNGAVHEAFLAIDDARFEYPYRLERHQSVTIVFQPERGVNLFQWNPKTKELIAEEVPRELTEVRAWISDSRGRTYKSKALKGSPEEWRSLGID